MTRLDRVLNLLERYDRLAVAALTYRNETFGCAILIDLRKEKEQLTKELIEHDCRRKN